MKPKSFTDILKHDSTLHQISVQLDLFYETVKKKTRFPEWKWYQHLLDTFNILSYINCIFVQ